MTANNEASDLNGSRVQSLSCFNKIIVQPILAEVPHTLDSTIITTPWVATRAGSKVPDGLHMGVNDDTKEFSFGKPLTDPGHVQDCFLSEK